MNILFITSMGVNPYCGGIERFSYMIGQRFISDGHKVCYLAFKHACDVGFEYNQSTYNQYYLPNSEDWLVDSNIVYLKKLVKDNRINVIFNQQGDSKCILELLCMAKSTNNVKIVSVLHFDPHHCINLYKSSLRDIFNSGLSLREQIELIIKNTFVYRHLQLYRTGRYFRYIYNQSDAFVLLSDNFKSKYLKMIGNTCCQKDKLYCIPNPITSFCRNDVGPQEKDNLIIFVGRLVFKHKRPDIFLKVWKSVYKEYPEWNCKVLGTGEYVEQMHDYIKEQSLERIEFCGSVNTDEYYRRAKIICVTSNTEGFPLVIIESSHFGVVPLAFESFNSVTDVIKDNKTGVIIPCFDINKYSDELRCLMDDNKRWYQMSCATKSYSSRFEMDEIIRKWYSLFNSL